jgi:hypothetical protein
MMNLTCHLDCCYEDAEVLVSTLLSLLHRLGLSHGDQVDEEAASSLIQRNPQREVQLLYLRFFNILMSRRKAKGEDGKVSWSLSGLHLRGEGSLGDCDDILCADYALMLI